MVKAPRDVNAPKRPATGYFLFCADERENVKSANPAIASNLGELAKAVGAAWAALGQERKSAYQKTAHAAMEKYHRKMEVYKKTDSYRQHRERLVAHKKESKKANRAKELKAMLANKPKRSLSAYMVFCNERRAAFIAAHPDVKYSEVMTRLAGEWNSMGDSDRVTYTNRAAADKRRYAREMEAYMQTEEYAAYKNAIANGKQAEKDARKAAKAKAKKVQQKEERRPKVAKFSKKEKTVKVAK